MIIGKKIRILVDRPLGSAHPNYPDTVYPVNYGYAEGIFAGDGEEQDVYLLGVDHPVREYEAEVIAVIHREDDVEEKWVAAPEGINYTAEEIREAVAFMERYFRSSIRSVKDTGERQ